MEEQIAKLVFKFNELEKLVNYNLQYLLLTWAILAVIVAVLAFAAVGLISKWVNDRVVKELEPIKDELLELQAVNRELIFDYNQMQEYGTWTPYIESGNNLYLAQSGKYYKLGKIVMVWFELHLTEKDAEYEGNVAIGGLPFVVKEKIECNCILANQKTHNAEKEVVNLSGSISKSNKIYLTTIGEGMNTKRLQYSQLANVATISGSLIYRIDD